MDIYLIVLAGALAILCVWLTVLFYSERDSHIRTRTDLDYQTRRANGFEERLAASRSLAERLDAQVRQLSNLIDWTGRIHADYFLAPAFERISVDVRGMPVSEDIRAVSISIEPMRFNMTHERFHVREFPALIPHMARSVAEHFTHGLTKALIPQIEKKIREDSGCPADTTSTSKPTAS